MKGIVEDFNALLAWLSYPCQVDLEEGNAPIELPKDPKKEAASAQIQANVIATKPAEDEEETSEDEDKEDKEEDACAPSSLKKAKAKADEGAESSDSGSEELPPVDEDEAAHQAQIAEC
jgi:hypothetical protein